EGGVGRSRGGALGGGGSAGSETPSAPAAWGALPPAASMRAPISAARWWPAATAPPRPRTVGRVAKPMRDLRRLRLFYGRTRPRSTGAPMPAHAYDPLRDEGGACARRLAGAG